MSNLGFSSLEKSQLRDALELYLLPFYPEKYLPLFVGSVRQIYELRFIIRDLPCNDFTVGYIADLISRAVDSNLRFRVLDTMKTLKAILKNGPGVLLSREVIKRLVLLYKHFVFSDKEDLRWCVSVFLKDRLLDDEDIGWLIAHHDFSEHIVNRLLRYPVYHPIIAKWARDSYFSNVLTDRLSELVALLIDSDIPKFVNCSDTKMITWAIYYARLPHQDKEKLLIQHLYQDAISDIVEVATRLEMPSVIEILIKKYW